MLYVFFFQAEDGIRDLTVTGVQTCALPICIGQQPVGIVLDDAHMAALCDAGDLLAPVLGKRDGGRVLQRGVQVDRKSTRLNSSHSQISYAVFCLKKKKNE